MREKEHGLEVPSKASRLAGDIKESLSQTLGPSNMTGGFQCGEPLTYKSSLPCSESTLSGSTLSINAGSVPVYRRPRNTGRESS